MKRTITSAVVVIFAALVVLPVSAAPPVKQLSVDASKVRALLGQEEPDIEAAMSVVEPYADARYPYPAQVDLAQLVMDVAGVAQGARKEELYRKAGSLAEVTWSDKTLPAPYRMRGLSVKGRALYELGKHFQSKGRATTGAEARTEIIKKSNTLLSEAAETFEKVLETRSQGIDAIYALIDDLAIKHGIPNHQDPESQFTKEEKDRLGDLRGAMNQAIGEGLLYHGWALYYRALNATQMDQENPLPGLRENFNQAADRARDANALEYGGLSLAGPWLYMVKPGMIPTSSFQADMGRARSVFRRFLEFAEGGEGAFFGQYGEAQVLYELGRYDEAIETFGKVVEANPPKVTAKNPGRAALARAAMRQIAECYFEMGQVERGKTAFQAMVKRFPDAAQDPETLVKLLALRSRAKALRARKMSGASQFELSEQALKLLNDPDLNTLLVDPAAGPQLFATVSDLVQLAGYTPDQPAVHFALGASALRSENFQAAIPHLTLAFEQAEKIKAKDFVTRVADMLIWCNLKVDPPAYRVAAEQARQAIDTATDPTVKAQFANRLAAIRYQQWQRARQTNPLQAQVYEQQYNDALKELVEKFPTSTFAQQAAFRLAESRRIEADDLMNKAAQARGTNKAEADKLQQQAFETMEKAIALYENIRSDSAYRAQALVMKGVTMQRLGDAVTKAGLPNAKTRRASLEAGAVKAWQVVADPKTTFSDESRAASARTDARIRLSRILFRRDDEASKQQAKELLALAAQAPDLSDNERAEIAFQRFFIAQEAGNLDEAAEQLGIFQKFTGDKRYAGFALRVFGHRLARRYRGLAKAFQESREKGKPDKAIHAAMQKLEKQIPEMLADGYRLNPMPGLSLEKAMSVMVDLILVNAYKEAYPVAMDIYRRRDELSSAKRNTLILLAGKAAMESDHPAEANEIFASHPMADKHAQLFQLRAQALTRQYEMAGDDAAAQGKAMDAIELWDKVLEQGAWLRSHPALRFEAYYNLLKIRHTLGKTNENQRLAAWELADKIRKRYPSVFPGSDVDMSIKLNDLLATILKEGKPE